MKSKSRNRAWGIIASVIMVLPFLLGLGGFATKASAEELAAGQANLILHKKKMLTELDPTIQNTGGVMTEFDQYQGLGDVDFKLYDATEEFYRLRADGKTVTDAVAEIQDWKPTDGPIASGTTDANGTLTFEKVDKKRDGKDAVYLIVESPKAGVTPAANMVVTFPVYQLNPDGSYTDTELSEINLYPKNVVSTPGSLIVTKKGTADGKELNGAQFVIKRTVSNATQYIASFDKTSGLYTWTDKIDSAKRFTTEGEGTFTVENLEVGDYTLVEVQAPKNAGMITAETEKDFKIEADKTAPVEVSVINDTIVVDKSTTKPDFEVGKATTFTIKFNIPEGFQDILANGERRYPSLVLTDTHDAALTLNADGKSTMTAGETFFTKDTDYKLVEAGNTFTVELTATGLAKAPAGKELVFTYEMYLNKDAVADGTFNNKVTVETGGLTTEKDINVTTGGKKFVKQDSDSKTALAGAVFKVYKEDKDGEVFYLVVDSETKAISWESDKSKGTEFTSNDEGRLEVTGLAYDTYYLEEVKAPDGYVLLTEAQSFEIGEGSYNGEGAIADTVVNKHKGTLPSTGGMGIVAFVAVGIVAIGGAYVYFAKGRRHIEG
ncbi:SpaH/EbpB family LPXTG-anchored major pilin [Enterococcus sp. AD013-P3]|uniref:SpaH/EbpB family LPXTG-anchored major pilin n=1 Tax=Enterococcus sp. AD013-P3 TaxID=3411036 RepID=UPI003B93EBCA